MKKARSTSLQPPACKFLRNYLRLRTLKIGSIDEVSRAQHALAALDRLMAVTRRLAHHLNLAEREWRQALTLDEPINGGDAVDWIADYCAPIRGLIRTAEQELDQ